MWDYRRDSEVPMRDAIEGLLTDGPLLRFEWTFCWTFPRVYLLAVSRGTREYYSTYGTP